MRILFVCMSNFCRSPMAEGIFQHLVKLAGLSHEMEADSAGTHDYQLALSPDTRAQETMLKHGIDISHMASRKVDIDDFHLFDHVIAMDHNNLATLKAMSPAAELDKIHLLMKFMPGDVLEVPDPYTEGEEGFEKVYQMIASGMQGLLKTLA